MRADAGGVHIFSNGIRPQLARALLRPVSILKGHRRSIRRRRRRRKRRRRFLIQIFQEKAQGIVAVVDVALACALTFAFALILAFSLILAFAIILAFSRALALDNGALDDGDAPGKNVCALSLAFLLAQKEVALALVLGDDPCPCPGLLALAVRHTSVAILLAFAFALAFAFFLAHAVRHTALHL